ncbi:hypothetical protein EJ065_4783 [Corallococcus coralloides]|uniref:Uncharacterized protein n=1 Tax=Corallococcus coralloides TaxID=184914 RepID=A0A410RWN3_CORCK|nr:hypothetical protein EJ065_4783 [Corallococcus coralloides]
MAPRVLPEAASVPTLGLAEQAGGGITAGTQEF